MLKTLAAGHSSRKVFNVLKILAIFIFRRVIIVQLKKLLSLKHLRLGFTLPSKSSSLLDLINVKFFALDLIPPGNHR